MKFKVLKGTPLFDALCIVKDKKDKIHTACMELCKEVGAEGYSSSPHWLAGGINAFSFKSGEKPEGWHSMQKYTNWFYPNSSYEPNKALLAKLSAIPKMEVKEINEPLHYKDINVYSNGGGLAVNHYPGVEWHEKYILIEVPSEIKYKPVDGMIEIKVSEFQRLQKIA